MCYVMTYKMFSEEKLPKAGYKNKKLVIGNVFPEIHLTVLNIKKLYK